MGVGRCGWACHLAWPLEHHNHPQMARRVNSAHSRSFTVLLSLYFDILWFWRHLYLYFAVRFLNGHRSPLPAVPDRVRDTWAAAGGFELLDDAGLLPTCPLQLVLLLHDATQSPIARPP